MDENLINNELLKYIKENVFKVYDLNGKSHDIDHIKYVLQRAFEISKQYEGLDYNMLFTAVSYHDIGDHIDRRTHEIISANWMWNDENLDKFFTRDQKQIIKEAIEDHRSSNKNVPRNIYGKILSSADRKVEVKQYLIASISYGKKKNPEIDKNESIESSYKFVIKKFGKNGYAINKSYVEDLKYKKFLEDIQYLIDNKELFIELATFIYDKLYN